MADPRAWEEEFVRVRDVRASGLRSDFSRELRAGALLPVCRGVYRRREFVKGDDDDRYLALLRGTQLSSAAPLTFAQLSAARIWRLPMVGHWPDSVHVTDEWKGGGRSTAGVVCHGWGMPDVPVERDGLRVTSLVRTVIDVARAASFEVGVTIADAALHGLRSPSRGWVRAPLPQAALEEAMSLLRGIRGCARARPVIAFADGRAESAGESVSRTAIRRAGLPDPVLQHEFRDRRGRMVVDFWWPDFGLIGEFDGLGKYLRDEFTRGRSASDIVIAEKHREDRLRALGPRVTRWGWHTAMSAPLLRDHLYRAGLRPH